jgi:hypothetical protein
MKNLRIARYKLGEVVIIVSHVPKRQIEDSFCLTVMLNGKRHGRYYYETSRECYQQGLGWAEHLLGLKKN